MTRELASLVAGTARFVRVRPISSLEANVAISIWPAMTDSLTYSYGTPTSRGR